MKSPPPQTEGIFPSVFGQISSYTSLWLPLLVAWSPGELSPVVALPVPSAEVKQKEKW